MIMNMMFNDPCSIPQAKKYYVVTVTFNNGNWYLADAKNKPDSYSIREWTSNADTAIHFDRKEDAETVALLLCDDIDYNISGISKIKQ